MKKILFVGDAEGGLKMDDLIKRQDAIDIVTFECGEWQGIANRINEQIQRLPSAEPVQKTGKWTIEDCHAATYKYCCSECNAHHRARYDFCPTCGTRMECEEE